MRSDLKELDITLDQLTDWTGMSDLDFKYYEVSKSPIQVLSWLVSGFFSALLGKDDLTVSREIWNWFYSRKVLGTILDRVYTYQKLIQAIDINDQLEFVGNPSTLSDRSKVLEVLKATRDDLARALKTEKILRDNKDFIASNPHMFANNLTALPTLQVSEQASEYGRLLDETLQVAVGVQQEIKKLQG